MTIEHVREVLTLSRLPLMLSIPLWPLAFLVGLLTLHFVKHSVLIRILEQDPLGVLVYFIPLLVYFIPLQLIVLLTPVRYKMLVVVLGIATGYFVATRQRRRK